MRTRSEQLREKHRRILAWSLGGAVAIHLAVFLLVPEFQVEPLGGSDTVLDTTGVASGANATVELLFGPPSVRQTDGSHWTAPPDRVLSAERDVRLEADCLAFPREGRLPLRGVAHLRVRPSGRVGLQGLSTSTGDTCGDRIIKEAADALWYRWLPDERFPAPVEVVQPVTLIRTWRAF